MTTKEIVEGMRKSMKCPLCPGEIMVKEYKDQAVYYCSKCSYQLTVPVKNRGAI